MARYLIEVPHANDHDGCIRALDAITRHGSHLVTHADFGCEDSVHVGWMIVDVDDQETAKQMVPPQFREDARIVKLRNWTREQIEEMVKGLES